MTSMLRACPACSRHVRVSEAACPFCGGVLDDAFRRVPSARAPTMRLSRAALFAVGATGFVAGVASGGSSAGSAYGGCPVDECIITSEASVEAAADGVPDGAASDAIVDSAGDVQSPQGDAAADAGANSEAGLGGCDNLGYQVFYGCQAFGPYDQ